MSFSLNPKGADPIVRIKKEDEKKNDKEKIIYYKQQTYKQNEEEDDNGLSKHSTKLQLKHGEFQLVPNTNQNDDGTVKRHVGYVTGQSGCGKTTFVINYLKEYLKSFKNNDIFLFSAIGDEGQRDKYNQLKPRLHRMKIDEKIGELNAKDFYDCCVVFDDMDCFKDKKIMKLVEKLRDEMLETGRHNGTFVIITYHLPTGGYDTRRMINEASFVVYYPKATNGKIKNLLENYIGLEKKQILEIKRKPTRWACIVRNVIPNVLITENEVEVMEDNDD